MIKYIDISTPEEFIEMRNGGYEHYITVNGGIYNHIVINIKSDLDFEGFDLTNSCDTQLNVTIHGAGYTLKNINVKTQSAAEYAFLNMIGYIANINIERISICAKGPINFIKAGHTEVSKVSFQSVHITDMLLWTDTNELNCITILRGTKRAYDVLLHGRIYGRRRIRAINVDNYTCINCVFRLYIVALYGGARSTMTNDNQGYEIACTYANTYVGVRNIYEMRSLQNIHCYSISKYITSSQQGYTAIDIANAPNSNFYDGSCVINSDIINNIQTHGGRLSLTNEVPEATTEQIKTAEWMAVKGFCSFDLTQDDEIEYDSNYRFFINEMFYCSSSGILKGIEGAKLYIGTYDKYKRTINGVMTITKISAVGDDETIKVNMNTIEIPEGEIRYEDREFIYPFELEDFSIRFDIGDALKFEFSYTHNGGYYGVRFVNFMYKKNCYDLPNNTGIYRSGTQGYLWFKKLNIDEQQCWHFDANKNDGYPYINEQPECVYKKADIFRKNAVGYLAAGQLCRKNKNEIVKCSIRRSENGDSTGNN